MRLPCSWNLNYQVNPGDDLGNLQTIKDNYDKVLNLYTQCRILWEIEQIANFLFRISSFCEEILHKIIQKLNAEQYFDRVNYPDDWFLDRNQVFQQLWQIFYNLENQYNANNRRLHDCNNGRIQSYRLPGRYSKRNFVEALIQFRGQSNEQAAWQEIVDSLTKLDYWIELRNKLTHSANGFSRNSMAASINQDRNRYRRGDRDEMAIKANEACRHNKILDELTKIMEKMAKLFNQSDSSYIGLNESYYIYSDVKQWVLDKLQQEGLN